MKTHKYEVGTDDAVEQILAIANGQPFEIVQILELPRAVVEARAAEDEGTIPSRFIVFIEVDPQIREVDQRMRIIIELFANKLYQMPIHKQDSVSYYDVARLSLEMEKDMMERDGYKIVYTREGWELADVNN